MNNSDSHKYLNGNYFVEKFNDGLFVRSTIVQGDKLLPEFPDHIELKITDFCDTTCALVSADDKQQSNTSHNNANITHNHIISDIKPNTEITIVDCNPLVHPALVKFVTELRNKNIDINLVVNQNHLIDDLETTNIILELVTKKLIQRLIVRLVDSADEKLYNLICEKFNNVIIEAVVGHITDADLDRLAYHNLSVLLIGNAPNFINACNIYQTTILSDDEIATNTTALEKRLKSLPNHTTQKFVAVGFDTTALKQLNMLNADDKSRYYIKDDDKFSMYIDLVNNKYAKTTSAEQFSITSNSLTIAEMFKNINS